MAEFCYGMHPFANKFRILKLLAKVALLGIPLGAAAWFLPHESIPSIACRGLAAASVAPSLIFGYVLTILHWKARYKGDHSDLWGVLLLLEAPGWFKLIYFIRHLLPDMMGNGRYVQR